MNTSDSSDARQAPSGFFRGAFSLLAALFTQTELMTALIKRDILTRYRGSLMGLLWSFINPLVLLATYFVVFTFFFKMNWGPDMQWTGAGILMLFSGLLPFNFFSEVISKSPLLIVQSPNYVKKVAFPVQLLPAVATGSALFHLLISHTLLLLALLFFRRGLPPTVGWLLLLWPPMVLFTLACSLLLAALGVFLRDLHQSIGLLLNVLFFMTPVFYPASIVPEAWQIVLYLNPVAFLVIQIREVCLYGQPPAWGPLLLFTAGSAALLVLAAGWFARVRRRFADVL